MKKFLVFPSLEPLLAALFLLLAGTAAHAQSCLARDRLIESLSTGYGEEVTIQALTSTGQVIEFARSDTGTWTLFMTLPTGMSCPIAAGKGVVDLGRVTGDPA